MGVFGGKERLLAALESDFKERLPGYHRSRREGLVSLAAMMLETRSANLMELAASLPRAIGSKDHRYQYIARLLGNVKIDSSAASNGSLPRNTPIRASFMKKKTP